MSDFIDLCKVIIDILVVVRKIVVLFRKSTDFKVKKRAGALHPSLLKHYQF